tara:strand:- start:25 stop:360 length:336 start_codon:yes stop_codon:yes gene_type:complete
MYILSFVAKKIEYKIQHPKWYWIFSKAEIVGRKNWSRVVINLDYSQEQCLEAFDNGAFKEVLQGIYGKGNLRGLQIEESVTPTEYIKTEGLLAVEATTNYLRYTEDNTNFN